jgi:cellulose synthase/poly-beta-1,6-N-acetylglucosamine synthase-like glycosyltransferase
VVTVFASILAGIHAAAVLGLAVYAFNELVLAILFLRGRARGSRGSRVIRDQLPSVLVQVPVYNELHVIERIIDAVASLDYPLDRLRIQILDDSDDGTTRLAEARAASHRQRGVPIEVLHRPTRAGYKAGALAWGLRQAPGEFVAVFDADFQPRPDFLLRAIPHLTSNPRLGMLQTRWSFHNASYSWLTRAQALVLDGHFVVEQTARSGCRLLMNNNGSGGVWRRACIEKSGGWSATTLCEDLDLSYRAQLAGWECAYSPDIDVPAEIPPQISAFKRQQARWARGSIQCLRKLGPALLASRLYGWRRKLMALVHLSGYASHPVMIVLLVASLPMLLVPPSSQIPLGGLGLIYLGPPIAYAIGQRYLYQDWARRMLAFPFLALLGIGIAWNNAKAVVVGLATWGGAFERTPKFRLETRRDKWESSTYRLGVSSSTVGEIALALYALVTAAAAGLAGRYAVVPFALLYAASFGSVAALEIAQALRARSHGRAAVTRAKRRWRRTMPES